MRKINRKKIVVTILLALVIIIELLALGISKAEKTKEIELNIEDYDNNLEDFVFKINAFDSGESGYYIVLPEFIDTKQIDKYFIKEKTIITEINEEENTVEETKVERKPGDEVYITEEELQEEKVHLQAIYKTKNVDNNILYNTKLEKVFEKEEKTISIEGYMPLNTSIKVNEITEEEIKIFNQISVENFVLQNIYNIKLINNEEEYTFNGEEYTYEVIISEMDTNKNYQLFQIVENPDTETTQEIKTELVGNKLKFNINVFAPFAVLESIIANEPVNEVLSTEIKKGARSCYKSNISHYKNMGWKYSNCFWVW